MRKLQCLEFISTWLSCLVPLSRPKTQLFQLLVWVCMPLNPLFNLPLFSFLPILSFSLLFYHTIIKVLLVFCLYFPQSSLISFFLVFIRLSLFLFTEGNFSWFNKKSSSDRYFALLGKNKIIYLLGFSYLLSLRHYLSSGSSFTLQCSEKKLTYNSKYFTL